MLGGELARRVWGMVGRVFPRCGMISQAIAFNVFLAFFPTLLLAVGFASSWIGSKTELLETIRNFTEFLPPGSQGIVTDFLERGGPDIWKYTAIGAVGTLLGGSQVMKLLMEGIHLIYGDEERIGFLHRQLRGLLLLLITMAPIVVAGIFGVFGKPLRHWLTEQLWKNAPVQGIFLSESLPRRQRQFFPRQAANARPGDRDLPPAQDELPLAIAVSVRLPLGTPQSTRAAQPLAILLEHLHNTREPLGEHDVEQLRPRVQTPLSKRRSARRTRPPTFLVEPTVPRGDRERRNKEVRGCLGLRPSPCSSQLEERAARREDSADGAALGSAPCGRP